MGCCALLQGIFPTQGLNLGLLHCRRMGTLHFQLSFCNPQAALKVNSYLFEKDRGLLPTPPQSPLSSRDPGFISAELPPAPLPPPPSSWRASGLVLTPVPAWRAEGGGVCPMDVRLS